MRDVILVGIGSIYMGITVVQNGQRDGILRQNAGILTRVPDSSMVLMIGSDRRVSLCGPVGRGSRLRGQIPPPRR